MSYQGFGGSSFGRGGRFGTRAISGIAGAAGFDKLAAAIVPLGAVVVGLNAAASALQKAGNNFADRLDKILIGQTQELATARNPEQLARYLQTAPGTTTWQGNLVRNAFTAINPISLLGGIEKQILGYFGPKPKTPFDLAVDQLSPAEQYEALNAPGLTSAQRAYIRNRLGGVTGHAIDTARAQQQYGASMYGQNVYNMTVNAPTGDRNSIGLAVKAAQDARDRNNGRIVATVTRPRG